MKRLFLSLLTVVSLVRSVRADVEEPVASINALVKVLIQTNPYKVVGWERIREVNDLFAAKQLSEAKGGRVLAVADWAKIVSDQTDYRCLEEKGSILIFPKSEAMPKGDGLARRMAAYPAASNVRSLDYYEKIQPANNGTAPFEVWGLPFHSANAVYGTISTEGGEKELRQVLNDLARKLGCRCWVIEDWMLVDQTTKNR